MSRNRNDSRPPASQEDLTCSISVEQLRFSVKWPGRGWVTLNPAEIPWSICVCIGVYAQLPAKNIYGTGWLCHITAHLITPSHGNELGLWKLILETLVHQLFKTSPRGIFSTSVTTECASECNMLPWPCGCNCILWEWNADSILKGSDVCRHFDGLRKVGGDSYSIHVYLMCFDHISMFVTRHPRTVSQTAYTWYLKYIMKQNIS